MYRQSLDPDTYNPRSIARQMNFNHESKYIDKIVKAMQARIADCAELIERTKSLAEQNVQLVETQLDDNGKAIMVFTIVTVTFLPPSFVSSYFGMNLQGISGTSARPVHFWEISAPLTIGVVVVCLAVVLYSPMQRRLKLRKEKMA
jgi:Mg2+ and Co2+ transporter CorA